MNHEICQASKEHLIEVFELWIKLMDIHKELDPVFFAKINEQGYKDDLKKYFYHPDASIYVCILEGKIVGYVTATFTDRHLSYNSLKYCTIGDIMVDKDFQRKGIGRLLYNSVVDWAKLKKADRVELDVIHKNIESYKFFRKLKFQNSWHTLELKLQNVTPTNFL